jgi:hypothetical protein
MNKLVEIIDDCGVTWIFNFKDCFYYTKDCFYYAKDPSWFEDMSDGTSDPYWQKNFFFIDNGVVYWDYGNGLTKKAEIKVQDAFQNWLVEKELFTTPRRARG